LCYRPPDDAPPPSARAGQIVFGSFNALPKINAPLAKLWSRILHSAPDSRIVLKNRGLASPMARQLILNLFAAEGIDPDRIELHGPQPNELAHLQFYGQIDIALDTFPYHGTTTTCEALWMGVPTVTLAGRAHVSRVGVSILNNVGLPELVADSPEQYVRIATELARDASRRKDLRSNLRKRMSDSPLMDAPGFARDIEAAFRKMWQTWCATPEKS
jgi:predicted O-linked N-acetylglucosamine transferase (SPINDLY family)